MYGKVSQEAEESKEAEEEHESRGEAEQHDSRQIEFFWGQRDNQSVCEADWKHAMVLLGPKKEEVSSHFPWSLSQPPYLERFER